MTFQITCQPSREDCERSDNDYDLGKAIMEKRPVNLINCGHEAVLCYPSTLTESGLQTVKSEAQVY